MTTYRIDEAQRTAAKVVGAAYLLAMATAVFAELYIPSRLLVTGDVAGTARNIAAHQQLFRFGIVADLVTFAADLILIAALYVVLSPVSKGLALLATLWRLIETSTMVAATVNNLEVLRLLKGGGYLGAFDTTHLQALARLSIHTHGAGYNVGMLFFGLGSTLFCALWYRSQYMPRALAALGVFGSLSVAAWVLAYIAAPAVADAVDLFAFMPIFIFEVTTGFWLLLKGLPRRATTALAGAPA